MKKIYREADYALSVMADARCKCQWYGSEHECDHNEYGFYCPDCGEQVEADILGGSMVTPIIAQHQVDEFLGFLLQASLEFNRKYHKREELDVLKRGYSAQFEINLHGDWGFRVLDWPLFDDKVVDCYVVGKRCNEFPTTADKFDPIEARDLLWQFARLCNKLEAAARKQA